MALKSTLLIVTLLTLAAVQRPKTVHPCAGLEATVQVSPPTFEHGSRPAVTILVRNTSRQPLRLLDIRNGNRPDLADNYYEIVLERNQRVIKDVPRAISDPGPINATDFFALAPGNKFEGPLSSSLDLSALPGGEYSIHADIAVDPLATPVLKCSSARTRFTVTNSRFNSTTVAGHRDRE
jgi:hypothetical protein